MAIASEVITDSKGRKLLVQEVGVLQQTRLLRAMGPAQASNQPYYNLVLAAAMVKEIDGTPTRPIASERDIDGAIERLGDEGMIAVQAHLITKMMTTQKEIEDAADKMQEELLPNPGPLEPSASSSSSDRSVNASTSSVTA